MSTAHFTQSSSVRRAEVPALAAVAAPTIGSTQSAPFAVRLPVALAPSPASEATPASSSSQTRWSVAGWAIARPGRPDPALVPSLGATQAGLRLSYAFGDARRLAAFARVSSPLARSDPELAAGVQWRPTRLPVTGFVEARQRRGLGMVPAAGAFGGVDIALPARFRLESYGQAGWVGGRIASGFAEGQARATRQVVTFRGLRFELGVGGWGAAQRGAARLDLGPTVGLAIPSSGASLRLALDWRQRVAGNAAPGSGPALTLAAGF